MEKVLETADVVELTKLLSDVVAYMFVDDVLEKFIPR